jgi:hypothetical protein
MDDHVMDLRAGVLAIWYLPSIWQMYYLELSDGQELELRWKVPATTRYPRKTFAIIPRCRFNPTQNTRQPLKSHRRPLQRSRVLAKHGLFCS